MENKYSFVSNRIMKNSKDEERGKLLVLVRKGSETAEVDYVCPECGLSAHTETEWIRPFAVKCSKCGFVLKLPRLKDEIKKDKKQAKKQAKKELEKNAGLDA
jgi:predicted RNA-binding Zn-ribbon protein involved in translation (DUF1610 family)